MRRDTQLVGPVPVHVRDHLMDVVSDSMDRIESVGLQLCSVLGESSFWQAYFRVRAMRCPLAATLRASLSPPPHRTPRFT